MGREIRRVPPDWDHPRSMRPDWDRVLGRPTERMAYTPMYDESLREAQENWDKARAAFYAEGRDKERWTDEDEAWARERYQNDHTIKAGELKHPTFEEYEGDRPPFYTDDDGVTKDLSDTYRPDWPEETRTAFQVYETVSEGTPVSPVFQTEEELVAWLCDPSRSDERLPRMSREAAARFVEHGSVPSLMSIPGVGLASNVEMLEPAFSSDSNQRTRPSNGGHE